MLPKSTRLYMLSAVLAVAGIAVSILGDREFKREHTGKVWDEASKETDGVSRVPGE